MVVSCEQRQQQTTEQRPLTYTSSLLDSNSRRAVALAQTFMGREGKAMSWPGR